MSARIITCVSVALLCTGAATAAAGPQPAGDPTLQDLKITAASDGTLTLSGQANSKAAAERTVAIARDSDGVKRVQSTLTVVRQSKH